jgi:predicted dinucleotide-binding enzyme
LALEKSWRSSRWFTFDASVSNPLSLQKERKARMYTAIIGLGNIGSRLAKNLVAGGAQIIIADKTPAKADALSRELGAKATAMSIADAITKADVIVLSIYFEAIKEFLGTYHTALAGKVIVDPSNPLAPNGKGGFKKTIPADQSSGQLLAALVPGDAELVKAFGTLAATSLESGANRSPDRAVLFYASDYPEAGRAVARLIKASGFSPVSVGGINQSTRIEVGGDLHEMGKLGKLVSAKEAEALV